MAGVVEQLGGLLTLYAAAVGLFLFGELRDIRRVQQVMKPVSSLLFCIMAWQAGAFQSLFGQIMFGGLVACALGDVSLLSRAQAWFRAGLFAFLLGHVFFIGAFASLDWALPRAVAKAGLLVLVGAGVFRWLRRHAPQDMQLAVGVYVIIILGMVLAAFGAWGGGATVLLPIAAVMFAVSDIGVARDRFVKQSWLNKLLITPLYYGAQGLFAVSVGLV